MAGPAPDASCARSRPRPPSTSRGSTSLDVPIVAAVVIPATAGRRDQCGCVAHGQYFELGERYADGDGCNTCTCEPGGGRCGLLLCNVDLAILERIHFRSGSAALTGAGWSTLDTVVDIMAAHPRLRIEVRGHTAPGEQRADRLSMARAIAVEAYLRARGVAATRVVAVTGVGATMPRGTDPRAERTVEFVAIEQ